MSWNQDIKGHILLLAPPLQLMSPTIIIWWCWSTDDFMSDSARHHNMYQLSTWTDQLKYNVCSMSHTHIYLDSKITLYSDNMKVSKLQWKLIVLCSQIGSRCIKQAADCNSSYTDVHYINLTCHIPKALKDWHPFYIYIWFL